MTKTTRKGVIFDVDGTLIDSVDCHAEAWQRALAEFGFVCSFQEIRNQIGKGGDQLLPVFVPRDFLNEHEEEIEQFRSDLFKGKYLNRIKAFPGVRPLFERILADGLKIALASSAKGDELEKYKKLAGISDLLDAETSSDDAEKSKPHPDIFLAAMDKAGLQAADCLVVGDSPYDAEAAGKAGTQTVGFLSGGFPEDWLRDAGCIAIYMDPEDLLARYDDSPLSS